MKKESLKWVGVGFLLGGLLLLVSFPGRFSMAFALIAAFGAILAGIGLAKDTFLDTPQRMRTVEPEPVSAEIVKVDQRPAKRYNQR